jgi:hypothetical protein
MLTGNGTIEYLVIDAHGDDSGTFEWTTNNKEGIRSGKQHFPNVEGIDQRGGILYFVSKLFRSMFALNLDHGTYTNTSTKGGMMDGQPDQLVRLIGDPGKIGDDLLYFTEEGGKWAGMFFKTIAYAELYRSLCQYVLNLTITPCLFVAIDNQAFTAELLLGYT